MLITTLDVFGIQINEALRVHEGRWWSYFCKRDDCCSPEGNPCSTGDSRIAAEATYLGQVALPSREALVALVAPVEGTARAAMTAATTRARERLQALLVESPRRQRAVLRAGRMAIREAEKRHRSGKPLTDDEVAWLGVLLVDVDVNEYALLRADNGQPWRHGLWSDVLRRVDPGYATAPACLLSFAAWRDGQGALARVAVDRALQADPMHRLAGLLDDVLGLGVGPHAMTALDSLERGGVLRMLEPGGPRDHRKAPGGLPDHRQAPGGPPDHRWAATVDRGPAPRKPGSTPKSARPKSGDARRARRLRRQPD